MGSTDLSQILFTIKNTAVIGTTILKNVTFNGAT